jgi:hypothetical protein
MMMMMMMVPTMTLVRGVCVCVCERRMVSRQERFGNNPKRHSLVCCKNLPPHYPRLARLSLSRLCPSLSLSLIEYDNKQQHNDILVRSAFQAWQVIVSASHSTPAIFGASLAPALCKLPVLPPLCKPPRAPTPAPPRPRKAMLWYNNERNQQRCCVCKGTNNDNDNDERERTKARQANNYSDQAQQ